MFSLGLLLLRLLSALPGPWLDLSDQVLAASGADAVRFSPVIILYIGREDGCTIGWEPAGRRFYRGWDGGKAMKEKEKTCKTIGCGRTFISSGRRLYCYTCRPAVLPNGASGDTPKIGKKRDSNAISPLTSDASAKASKASFLISSESLIPFPTSTPSLALTRRKFYGVCPSQQKPILIC